MRLALLSALLLSPISYASSSSVEIAPTPRVVLDTLDQIFGDDDEEEEESAEEVHVLGVMDLERVAIVREINTPDGAHIEWDTGNVGARFVRFRAAPGLTDTHEPIKIGEIVTGGHIVGTPFFYFIVLGNNGHRTLWVFGFREGFMLVQDLGDLDFEVAAAGPFQGNPEELFLVIRRGDNYRAFYWTHFGTLPLICPDLEDGMTVRRAGRLVGTAPVQTFWIIDIAQNPHLFVDADEADLAEFEQISGGAMRRRAVQPPPPVEEKKKTFQFSWRKKK